MLELTPLNTHQTRLFSLELEIPDYLFASPAACKQDIEAQFSASQNPKEGTENNIDYTLKGAKEKAKRNILEIAIFKLEN